MTFRYFVKVPVPETEQEFALLQQFLVGAGSQAQPSPAYAHVKRGITCSSTVVPPGSTLTIWFRTADIAKQLAALFDTEVRVQLS